MKNIARILSLILSLTLAPLALADTVTLKDGTVHEGEITREGDGFVYIEVKVGDITNEILVLRDDIESIDRSDPAPEARAPARRPAGSKRQAPAPGEGVERVAFISLEGQVGPLFNANALSESVDILNELPEERRPTIVVLTVNSGGGALNELAPLHEVINKEIKPYYRTVSWIESAISAAAMTSWVVPEIYLQTKGNIGACTAFSSPSGQNVQMDGRGLQNLLLYMEEVSREGGYDPYIMRAMQISGPSYPTTLSADVDERGRVTWYIQEEPDAEPKGEHLVSPHNEILTFDSRGAEFFGLSRGTADTKEELMRQMGIQEWVEVGHDAGEHMIDFRERVQDAQVRLGELQRQLNAALANAESGRSDCARWIGKARRIVGQIRSTVRGTSLEEYSNYQGEWFEIMEEQIRDLQLECNERRR